MQLPVADGIALFLVHNVQALVRPDIKASVKARHRVHHLLLHGVFSVDIRNGRAGKPQQSQSGGGEPVIALIVHQNIVNGIIELTQMDGAEYHPALEAAYAVVSAGKKLPVLCEGQAVDLHQIPAAVDPPLLQPVLIHIKTDDLPGGGPHIEIASPVEAAACINDALLPAGVLKGHLFVPENKELPGVGHRRHLPPPVRVKAVGIDDLRHI